MGRRQRPREESSIPYYQLRNMVERGYGRRALLRKNAVWGLIAGGVVGLLYGLQTPNANTLMVVGTIVIAGFAVGIILVFAGLMMEQLGYSTEEESLVEACTTEIERRKFSDPVTLTSLREAASSAADAVQIRSPLPLAIVGGMIAALAVDIPVMSKVVVVEMGFAMLLYLVMVSGQANADLVIRQAVTEFERRLRSRQDPPAEQPTIPSSSSYQHNAKSDSVNTAARRN